MLRLILGLPNTDTGHSPTQAVLLDYLGNPERLHLTSLECDSTTLHITPLISDITNRSPSSSSAMNRRCYLASLPCSQAFNEHKRPLTVHSWWVDLYPLCPGGCTKYVTFVASSQFFLYTTNSQVDLDYTPKISTRQKWWVKTSFLIR